jgi:hypothetical protein
MSTNTKDKKKKAAIVAAALMLITGGGAFAYWTTTGTGTGTATTGSTVDITVMQTSTVSAMGPGDAAQTLSGNFDNPNPGPVYVSTVTASISSVDKAVGAPAGTCDASDYTLASAVMTVNAQVPAGTAQGAWTGATIQFNNTAANQDGCKLATVNLAYTIS